MAKIGLVWLALSLLLTGCGGTAYPRVSLAEAGAPAPTANPDEPRKLPLRVAIAAIISPQATLDAYGPLLDYLPAKLERPVQLIQRGTYAEINELIRSGGADVAFVCGGAYVEGQREFGMELLAAPMPKLLIVGGHIGRPLKIMGAAAGGESTWLRLSKQFGQKWTNRDA